jgi:hypothetical protein
MRLARMTTRRWMIVVALVAIPLAVWTEVKRRVEVYRTMRTLETFYRRRVQQLGQLARQHPPPLPIASDPPSPK